MNTANNYFEYRDEIIHYLALAMAEAGEFNPAVWDVYLDSDNQFQILGGMPGPTPTNFQEAYDLEKKICQKMLDDGLFRSLEDTYSDVVGYRAYAVEINNLADMHNAELEKVEAFTDEQFKEYCNRSDGAWEFATKHFSDRYSELFEPEPIHAVYIESGIEPYEIRIDANNSVSHIQELVGSAFDIISVTGDGIDLYVNDNGLFECSPNRNMFANKHMQEVGYLSQFDFLHPVVEGEIYTRLYGPIVACSVDKEGNLESLTPWQIEAVKYKYSLSRSNALDLDSWLNLMSVKIAEQITSPRYGTQAWDKWCGDLFGEMPPSNQYAIDLCASSIRQAFLDGGADIIQEFVGNELYEPDIYKSIPALEEALYDAELERDAIENAEILETEKADVEAIQADKDAR